MPLYEHACAVCGHTQEDFQSLSAPAPEHCGQPMKRQMGLPMLGTKTRGGVPIYSVTTTATGKGNRRPVTIGRGHGLGGHRPNPTFRNVRTP